MFTQEESRGNLGPSFTKSAPKARHDGFGRSGNRRNHKETVSRGRKIPMGDCEAQEATIGEFPFVAVDFGDTIRVSGKIRRSAQKIENRDPISARFCIWRQECNGGE